MSPKSVPLTDEMHAYLLRVGVREPEVLRRLREETAMLPMAIMQIAPEQGAFLGLLAELIGARRCLEIGTFTGYSSLSVALRLPADGHVTCLDVSEEWTNVARRYWAEAGVADRMELRLGPATDTLAELIREGRQGSYDFAFIDANKEDYPAYYEASVRLVRPGGLIAVDNVFRGGAISDMTQDSPELRATRELNERMAGDERVSVAMVPIADGMTLARKR